MKISNEIIQMLKPLKGMDTNVAYKLFKSKGLETKRKDGFVENMIALLIGRELPKNHRGMDFPELFEVKEIKVKFNQYGEMSSRGDTMISAYLGSEPNFFESNIWDKTKSVLVVCVDDKSEEGKNIIVDIRYFDGEPFAQQLKKDYDSIQLHKNLCRSNNEILAFKTGRNFIAFKNNTAIENSESLFEEEEIEIENQEEYIRSIFDDKFASYRKNAKNVVKSILTLMDRLSLAELEILKTAVESKMKESVGFDLNAGEDLPF